MLVDCQRLRPRPAQVSTGKTPPNKPESAESALFLSSTHDIRSEQHQLLKRRRLRADVDGEGSENLPKKKRRLRVNLITSRLSKPYATPATHISGRRATRVGIWSRQKVVGRNLLQKAAVLNSIRINRMAAKAAEQRPPEFAEMTSIYDNIYLSGPDATSDNDRTRTSSTKPVPFPEEYIPPFLSVDLLSHDAEDDDDATEWEEDDEGEVDMIYSDFSSLDSDDANYDDNEFFHSFGSNEIEQFPLRDSSENVIRLILENENHDEVSIAHGVP